MNKFIGIGLLLGASFAVVVLFPRPEIRQYTADDLIGLTCQELSEKHEEVIFAYHDASIAEYNKTGSFGENLGLPKEDVLPFVIVMKMVIQDNALEGFDLSKPFFHSATVSTPQLHKDFYAEASSLCATNPTFDAMQAMAQAANTLGLTSARID